MVKFMGKILNFDSFGGCIPTFLPIRSAPYAKLHVYMDNVSPVRCKKIQFGLLRRLSAIPTWPLRSDLPVITPINKIEHFCENSYLIFN